MNKIKLYSELEKPIGLYLQGFLKKRHGDILIGEKSLKQALQQFFNSTCKTCWIGFLDSQPESYAVRYLIVGDQKKTFYDRVFMSEWIGGNKGYDWVIQNNEDIYDLLSEYEGHYIYFGI